MQGRAHARDERSAKFERRRAEILDVGSDQINISGARGMTLTAVAKALGLDTSSVTYYFRRKDDLAAACLQRTLECLRDAGADASAQPDARARVRHLLSAQFDRFIRRDEPGLPRLALLSDLQALADDARAPLDAIYGEIVRIIRDYFGEPDTREGRAHRRVAIAAVLATSHWLPGWIVSYFDADLPRVEERLFDILEHGLVAQGRTWPLALDALEGGALDAQARFLHAATNMINAHGYRGASVERIAAELGVSSGSFYHHLDNKDDLVVACFERSFAMIERAGQQVENLDASAGEKLGAMISKLVAFQFTADSPLLRTGAYLALPPALRELMMQRTARVTHHIAGVISDGIADGSLRPVDPLVASQTVLAIVNSASDLRKWAGRRDLDTAVTTYVAAIRGGIFQN